MITTTVAFRFKGATLRAEIDPADVDRMLRDVGCSTPSVATAT